MDPTVLAVHRFGVDEAKRAHHAHLPVCKSGHQSQGRVDLGFEVTEGIPWKRNESDGSGGKPRKTQLFGILQNIRKAPSLFFGTSEEFVKTSEEFRNSVGAMEIEEE